MKKIGLIGGLSWVSTAEYYRQINRITQSMAGGVTSARISLESVNRQPYVDAVITRQDEQSACNMILEAARNLERAGADFIVITCNDVHRFVPEISPHVGIPFLHIAETTASAIKQQGLKQVSLLGVKKTMECDFYPDILAKHGIATLIPDEAEKQYIHDKIYEELVHDRFLEETRKGYLSVMDALGKRGAEGVILGCTEIPLLLSAEQIPQPSFATTDIHCRAAVEYALS